MARMKSRSLSISFYIPGIIHLLDIEIPRSLFDIYVAGDEVTLMVFAPSLRSCLVPDMYYLFTTNRTNVVSQL